MDPVESDVLQAPKDRGDSVMNRDKEVPANSSSHHGQRPRESRPLGVSIVICCHNSADRLPVTLHHLVCQVVPDDIPWEVVVVDNASTDGTADVARSCWPPTAPVPLQVVHESALGLAHARECGIRESRFEYVSFIDDDNWVCPDWVAVAFATMSDHPEVALCGPNIYPRFESDSPDWFDAYAGLYAVGPQGTPGDVTAKPGSIRGAGMTLRRSAWQALLDCGYRPILLDRRGGNLNSGEDLEICYAIRLAGWHLWYEPALSLEHYLPRHRLTWSYLRRLYRASGAAESLLWPYRMVFEFGPLGTLHWSFAWSGVIRTTVWELAHNPRRWMKYLGQHESGDPDVLWVEWRLGRVGHLVRCPRDFRDVLRRLRSAPWNPDCVANDHLLETSRLLPYRPKNDSPDR